MEDPRSPSPSVHVLGGEARVRDVATEWEEALPASRIRRRRKRVDDPFLNLTSMVDVLSVLMFFLLTIYTGGGFLTVLPQGLVLPNSITTTSLTRNLEVSVLKDEILVEREPVGDDPRIFAENEELLLPGLHEALAAHAPQAEPGDEGTNGANAAQTAPATDTRVTIAADKAIPFRLLKKVMYTVDQAGFRLQSLAVKSISG